MNVVFKWIAGLALGTIALALIGAALLFFVVDPNQYKPQLQQLAKEKQIDLHIDGELSWQLWPDMAISAADTRISGAGLPDIRVSRTGLALELASLMGGELAIQKVTIDEPLIRLDLNDNNASQQAAAIASAPLAATATSEPNHPFAIHSLTIRNGTVELLDNGLLQQRIDNLNISGQQINLDNQPFPFELAFTTTLPGVAEKISLHLSGQVNNNLQHIALSNGSAILDIASQVYGNRRVSGQFSAELDREKKQLSLPQLELALDDFVLRGHLSATLSQQRHIDALLTGTTLNLDNYTSGDASSATGNTNKKALFAPLLAPLALLQGGRGQIKITLEKLITQGIELTNVQLDSLGHGHVLELANASANGFGGSIQSNARIDLSQQVPQLEFAINSNGVELGSALATVADFHQLSGSGNLQFSGTSRGNSTEDLTNNLRGSGTFTLSELHYSATNIEQQLCAVAGDKNQQPDTWPKGTHLNTTDGHFALDGQTLILNNVTSGVGNVALRGQGDLQLQQGLMDMRLVLNIKDSQTSENGCALRSTSIQNRDIPLHLRGPFAEINSVLTSALVNLMTRTLIESKASGLLDKLLGGNREATEEQPNDDDSQPKDSKRQVKDLLQEFLKQR